MHTYEPNQAEANICRRVQSLIREKRGSTKRDSTVVINLSILVAPDGTAMLIPDGAGVAEQIGMIDK